jgi:F-box protein 11
VDLSNPANAGPYLDTCLPMNAIWDYLKASPARHRLLLADACYGGLLAQSRSLPERPETPNPAFIASMLAKPALQVMTAGGKDEEAVERPEWGHGAFTYKLLDELRNRAATLDQVFLASDLAVHLKTAVGNLTKSKQHPQFGSYAGTEGEFLFVTMPPTNAVVVSADGKGQFRSLAEAIRAAEPHTQILVRPGVYKEGIVIDKPVEIIGNGELGEVVVESAEGPCVYMGTDHAVVQGLTLRGMASHSGRKFHAADISRGRLVLDGCDITNASAACVAIYGDANPVVKGCKIHGGPGGIVVAEKASGLIESCDVYANEADGVTIAGGDPVVRNCTIHDGSESGIIVYKNGKGTIESCRIYKNKKGGIGIGQGANPDVRNCTIYECEGSGVDVDQNSRGTVEDCDIYSNQFGMSLQAGSDVTIRGCKIHDARLFGAGIMVDGQGSIENCEIYNNEAGDVSIGETGNPTVKGCKIHGPGGTAGSGIFVSKSGRGRIEDCDISTHMAGGAGVWVSEGANPVIVGCRIHDEDKGMFIDDDSRATVENCDIYRNLSAGIILHGCAGVVIRRCRIQRNSIMGLYAFGKAKATLEDCDLTGNGARTLIIEAGSEIKQIGNRM